MSTLKPSREIAFPFRIGPDGGVAYVEDPYRAYFQHIVVVVLTSLQERLMLPEFGTTTRSYLFENIDDLTGAELALEVEEALRRWETAIVIERVSPILGEVESGSLGLQIEFSVPPRRETQVTVIDVGGAVLEERTIG